MPFLLKLCFVFLLVAFSFSVKAQKPDLVIQVGHSDIISCIAISSDNELMITGGSDKLIKVWDVSSQFVLQTLNGHLHPIKKVATTSDKKYIYSLDESGTLIQWGLTTGKNLTSFKCGENNSDFVLVNSGELIVLGNGVLQKLSANLKILMTVKNELATHITLNSNHDVFFVKSGEYSSTNITKYTISDLSILQTTLIAENAEKFYVSSSEIILVDYKAVFKQNIESGIKSNLYEINELRIRNSLLVEPNKLFIAFEDGSLMLLNTMDGKKTEIDVDYDYINAITPFNNEPAIAIANGRVGISILDVNDLFEVKKFASNVDLLLDVEIQNDDVIISSFNPILGPSISSWSITKPRTQLVNTLSTELGILNDVDFSPERKRSFAIGPNQRVTYIDNAKNEVINYWQDDDAYTCITSTKSGKKAIVGTKNGELLFYSPSDKSSEKLKVSSAGINSIAHHPKQTMMLAGDNNGHVFLCNWDSVIWQINTHGIGSNYSEKDWSMPYFSNWGIDLETFTINSVSITNISFSTTGDTIAVCGGKRIQLINSSGKQLYAIDQPQAGFSTLNISPNGKYLVAGGADRVIYLYDLKSGKLLQKFSSHTNEIRSVRFTKNAKGFISVSMDGILNFWEISKSIPTVSMALSNGAKDYIFFNSDGYYMASPNMSKLVSFKVGNQIVPFENFEVQFNRPDVILKSLSDYSMTCLGESIDSTLISSYKNAYEKRMQILGLNPDQKGDLQSIPTLTLSSKSEELIVADSLFILEANAQSLAGLDRLHVLINGVPLYGKSGKSISGKSTKIPIEISLNQGNNEILIYCSDIHNAQSFIQKKVVDFRPKKQEQHTTIYVGIGVNAFQDSSFNLKYSASDIEQLSNHLSNTNPKLKKIILLNQDVTRERILTLKKELLSTGVNDQIIFHFSGHGLLDNSLDFYFATYDMDFYHPEERGISFYDIESLLDSIPARKKLILMDACHSGEVDKTEVNKPFDSKTVSSSGFASLSNAKKLGEENTFELMGELFVNLNKGSGTAILSSSSGKYYSYEFEDFEGGVFTYAILKGLKGEANKDNNSFVDLDELWNFTSTTVQKLTRGKQKPNYRQTNTSMVWQFGVNEK